MASNGQSASTWIEETKPSLERLKHVLAQVEKKLEGDLDEATFSGLDEAHEVIHQAILALEPEVVSSATVQLDTSNLVHHDAPPAEQLEEHEKKARFEQLKQQLGQ